MFPSRYLSLECHSRGCRAPCWRRPGTVAEGMNGIPKSHPRYASLMLREKLVEGFRNGVVVPQGLIAHGRGEMFDYLLGERTTKESRIASRAAAAILLRAKRPVISVNGNVAALCPRQIVHLAEVAHARIEVGLFHRTDERVSKIQNVLIEHGAKDVLGFLPDAKIPGLEHMRGLCSKDGIYSADVVLIPLEDGDRAEALAKMGKKTVAIDLNPMSRTSRASTVVIVDEVTRAFPELIRSVEDLQEDAKAIGEAIKKYDRDTNLKLVAKMMSKNLSDFLDR